MVNNINRNDIPDHFFSIPELDLSTDLFTPPLNGQWFKLGIENIDATRNEQQQQLEKQTSRRCLLMATDQYAEIYPRLRGAGLGNFGPQSYVRQDTEGQREYCYIPFYEYELKDAVVEPLVYLRNGVTSGQELFINPDLYLYLKLEKRTPDKGIWWDPYSGSEALRSHIEDNERIVEIRNDYLLRYLQARQLSLIVAHYRHLHLHSPTNFLLENFIEEEIIRETDTKSTKVLLQSAKLAITKPFLRHAIHRWFEIKPPSIDPADPWSKEPNFDPMNFTFPTRIGEVAPARWKSFKSNENAEFAGETGDNFQERVFFRQDVLSKYEGSAGFSIADDGSVTFREVWGLDRNTQRLGDELIATMIGDFAEGVPFEEWHHWRQFVVSPPSNDTLISLRKQKTVVSAVNGLVHALEGLEFSFSSISTALGSTDVSRLWKGSPQSLVGRQLKWIYSVTADDDEFLKRATLTSTLVIDELNEKKMREVLKIFQKNLHLANGKDGQPLGSRNLLQRMTLIATLITQTSPNIASTAELTLQAESQLKNSDVDLQLELQNICTEVRQKFAPIAFLYDLRTFAGLAHPANNEKASEAALKLGLPSSNWNRRDYLELLKQVTESINHIANRLDASIETILRWD